MSVAPTENNLLVPRIVHVEETLKQVTEGVRCVDLAQTELEKRHSGSWLTADVVLETVEYISAEEDHNKVIATVSPSHVAAGDTVSLAYPMVEGKVEGESVFLMRRRFVDPYTAEVGASFIIVHTPGRTAADTDVSHVSNFRFM